MVNTDELGSPTFYTPDSSNSSPNLPRKTFAWGSLIPAAARRISHNEMKSSGKKNSPSAPETDTSDEQFAPVIDERDMIMELVRDIAMDLDVTSVSHRILQVNADGTNTDVCFFF